MSRTDKQAMDRQARHLSAIQSLLGRDRIELDPKRLVHLLAYFQTNLRFQREAIRGLASAAAGTMDWDAIDKMIETAELSEEILDKFIFEIADE